MTADQKARLYSLLLKLAAEDLAVQLGRVADVRDLPFGVRGEIADVLGHEGPRTTAAVYRHLVNPSVSAGKAPMDSLFVTGSVESDEGLTT